MCLRGISPIRLIHKLKAGTNIYMKITLPQKLFISIKEAHKKLLQLSPKEKSVLEKKWDVEHAYYSSALEGSNLDKKEFEKLAEKIA